MKKHIISGLALLLFLIMLLDGLFYVDSNAPGESMAGLAPIFATVVSLVAGALGWGYYKVGKRHEQRSSGLERGLLTLCIVITIVVPILMIYDFGLPEALAANYFDRYIPERIERALFLGLKKTFLGGQFLMLLLLILSFRPRKDGEEA